MKRLLLFTLASLTLSLNANQPQLSDSSQTEADQSERQLQAAPSKVSFTLPGIIGLQEGYWRGIDHLLNLSSDIYISVDIVGGEKIQPPFSEEEIKSFVSKKFLSSGLTPNAPASWEKPPLPYLHFVIMIQRCGDEYASFVQARLFEDVKLPRVSLPREVNFQAITWEDDNFLIMQYSSLREEVFNQIGEMTDYFIQRYEYFEKQEMRMRRG